MLTWRWVVATAGTVLACGALSGGAPIEFGGATDPPASGTSWFVVVGDPVEGVFESPSWDVARVEFIALRSAMGIILDTVGPFDRNGGDTSITRTTRFIALLTERGGPGSQLLELTLTDKTEELRIDGVPVEPGPFPYQHWDARIFEGDLWVNISWYLLDPFVQFLKAPGFRIEARLDDCDVGADDMIAGWVPEPAGLALLASGALALLTRRRARKGGPLTGRPCSGPPPPVSARAWTRGTSSSR